MTPIFTIVNDYFMKNRSTIRNSLDLRRYWQKCNKRASAGMKRKVTVHQPWLFYFYLECRRCGTVPPTLTGLGYIWLLTQ